MTKMGLMPRYIFRMASIIKSCRLEGDVCLGESSKSQKKWILDANKRSSGTIHCPLQIQ